MLSIAEFWRLAAASGVVGTEQIALLQSDFDQIRGAASSGNTRTLCEWLIDRKALSRFQCDVLLLGQPGPFQYGDYMVTDRLAAGRLSGLFRATHLPTGQTVLLKFLGGPAAEDAARLAAVRSTAEAWSRIDDPRLAACYEFLEVGTYKLLSTTDLRGQSAAEWLRATGRMSPTQACTLAREAALALDSLASHRITHGDVRPENIWCQMSGAAQLIGFPLARDPLGPPAGLDPTTADYAAPELAEPGAMPTPLADVYALGCTLYELLTGHPPFAGGRGTQQTIAAKMARHATEPIIPLDQFGAMPEGLNRVVSFMMAKNPAIRFASAAIAAEALAPYATAVAKQDGSAAAELRSYCHQRPTHTKAPDSAGGSGIAKPHPPIVAPAKIPPVAATFPVPPVATSGTLPQPPGTSPLRSPTSDLRPSPAPLVPDLRLPASFQPGLLGPPGTVPTIGKAPPIAGLTAGNIAVMRGFAPKPAARPASRFNPQMMIGGGVVVVVALLALGLYIAGKMQGPKPDASKGTASSGQTTGGQTTGGEASNTVGDDQTANPGNSPADHRPRPTAVADDGTTLWASPTQGAAPQVRYVAPGAQAICILRPHSLLGSARGRQTFDAMGPAGAALLTWIEAQAGQKSETIDRLDIAVYEAFGERPAVSLVAYLKKRPPTSELVAAWGNPSPVEHAGQTYYQQDDLCHYVPPGDKQAIVVAPRARLDEILAAGNDLSRLDSNMQELIDAADVERHVNAFFLPVYLRAARDTLYPGTLSPVRDALDWFLGTPDEALAGAVSLELSDPFFAELRLFPARNKKPIVVARDLKQRIDDWSPRVQSHLFTLSLSPYSREVLRQLPFMLESVGHYTRHGADGRVALVRWYLPGTAAPNLALAADLLLLETAGTASTPTPQAGPAEKTVWDRLKQPVTVSFERDSLENALKLLSTEMGVKIEIVGNDLKLDGITKNQPLGLDMRNRPAEEVLNQIMLLANPDRTVKKLSDQVQKLVYVVKPKYQGDTDTILITTRAKAAEHGPLPEVFKVVK